MAISVYNELFLIVELPGSYLPAIIPKWCLYEELEGLRVYKEFLRFLTLVILTNFSFSERKMVLISN